jgi:hypothetical protein
VNPLRYQVAIMIAERLNLDLIGTNALKDCLTHRNGRERIEAVRAALVRSERKNRWLKWWKGN